MLKLSRKKLYMDSVHFCFLTKLSSKIIALLFSCICYIKVTSKNDLLEIRTRNQKDWSLWMNSLVLYDSENNIFAHEEGQS